MNLRGIIPPVVTPMQANEDLDLPRLQTLLDFFISHRVHAVFVLGTTGEFFALSEREKQDLIATTVAHVNHRVPVVAGTGAESTREVVRLTQMAEREGADAVAVITPYYVHPTQDEIAGHFRRVADSTSLPVLLYHNPAPCGGVKLDPGTVAKLAETPNIVGIKDSFGDLTLLIEFVRATPPEFAVFQGRDTLIAPALEYGAKGAVPGVANFAPQLAVAIWEAHERGDRDAARAAQLRLSPLRLALSSGTAPGGIKAAMKLAGLNAGPCRSPVGPLPPDQEQRLKNMIGPGDAANPGPKA